MLAVSQRAMHVNNCIEGANMPRGVDRMNDRSRVVKKTVLYDRIDRDTCGRSDVIHTYKNKLHRTMVTSDGNKEDGARQQTRGWHVHARQYCTVCTSRKTVDLASSDRCCCECSKHKPLSLSVLICKNIPRSTTVYLFAAEKVSSSFFC